MDVSAALEASSTLLTSLSTIFALLLDTSIVVILIGFFKFLPLFFEKNLFLIL